MNDIEHDKAQCWCNRLHKLMKEKNYTQKSFLKEYKEKYGGGTQANISRWLRVGSKIENGKTIGFPSFETGKEHKRMIKKITRDPMFLAQKSVDATEADKQVISDLLDTLRANLDHCVGMAANMIGVSKNIIVVAAGPFQFAMINPVIAKKTGAFQTEEGCLSLDGVRPCTRYKEIEVDYLDTNFKKQHGKYIGWTAQIIQHEVDHCNGIVI